MAHVNDKRWYEPGSGYESGSYLLFRKHCEIVELAICKLAEEYAEERSADGPLLVTCEDMKKAIENYEV